ncbi:MAG: CHASE2 domain-containing protein [Vicinamibacterales bacterium]
MAIGVGAWLVALGLGRTGFLQTIELKTYDLRLRAAARPETARKDIVLVEIDESSLRQLEPLAGRWPWPRAIYASLLDFLAGAGARAIAIDVLFLERDTREGFDYGGAKWSGVESDAAFVAATRRAANVVLLADAVFEGMHAKVVSAPPWPGMLAFGPEDGPWRAESRPTLTPPFPELASAAANIGHNFMSYDPDGPWRRWAPFVQSDGRVAPSLGLAAMMVAEKIQPQELKIERDVILIRDRRVPVLREQVAAFGAAQGADTVRALINYQGPALLEDGRSRPYSTYAFYDVLYSAEQQIAGRKPDLDPALFNGKIVVVGATAQALFDVFQTPFERGRMPGIQVHANTADNVLSGRFMRPAGDRTRITVTAVAALIAALLFATLQLRWALLSAAALVAAYAIVSLRLFSNGVWIATAQPFVALVLAAFGGVGYQYLVEGREKRKVKGLFGRYVSKDVYDQLMSDPALAELGGKRRQMTVLFSDIRGFTSHSEKGQPEDIVATLNEYFTRMVEIVFRHQGTLDKFVGDMVMALFGAPLDDEEHADHAVEAAIEMVAELKKLNVKWAEEGRPPLDIGIGINTGDMIAGNIGSQAIMSYTVIGDAVNLGSRLESLNKEYGTRIIISDATRSRLKGSYPLRPLGDVIVKGKTKPVAILEVQT